MVRGAGSIRGSSQSCEGVGFLRRVRESVVTARVSRLQLAVNPAANAGASMCLGEAPDVVFPLEHVVALYRATAEPVASMPPHRITRTLTQ